MNHQLAKLIEKQEIELLQPKVRKSAKRIGALLADDFLEFGMFGKKFSKRDMVKLLPNSKNEKNEKYIATGFKAKEIAPNTIRLTYKASIEYITTGKKILTLRCSLWQKRNNKWQMIFHQGTPIK